MTNEPASTTAAAPAADPASDVAPTTPTKKPYTLADLKAHVSEASCWVLIHGKVYDVTPFLDEHPGGFDIILSSTGKGRGVKGPGPWPAWSWRARAAEDERRLESPGAPFCFVVALFCLCAPCAPRPGAPPHPADPPGGENRLFQTYLGGGWGVPGPLGCGSEEEAPLLLLRRRATGAACWLARLRPALFSASFSPVEPQADAACEMRCPL